ncbi:carbohydrate (N-acetylglucosamine 6-O) sulfotransferase [Chamberlinius hualienensis]
MTSLPTNKSSSSNILLLAYQRSGSSFVGELLTSDSDSTYIFEPLIEFMCLRNIRDETSVLSVMKKMFNCDRWTLDNLSSNRTAKIRLLRKTGRRKLMSELTYDGCLASKLRVIKTIRLRMKWAKKLLNLKKLNLKIVHLVRDPRAILNSMNLSETWKSSSKRPEHQCREMREDLAIGSTLPNDRYVMVRYEDVVENPLEMASQIFRRLGMTLPKSLAFYITTHTETEKFFKHTHQHPDYFSTYRKSNYDFTSWKYSLNVENRKEIEKSCADIIHALSYPPIL